MIKNIKNFKEHLKCSLFKHKNNDSSLQLKNNNVKSVSKIAFFFFFFFLLFFGFFFLIFIFPVFGFRHGYRFQPKSEPQQCQVQAASETYTTAHGNA